MEGEDWNVEMSYDGNILGSSYLVAGPLACMSVNFVCFLFLVLPTIKRMFTFLLQQTRQWESSGQP